MTRFGYFLSCEEYGPADLVRQARLVPEDAMSAPAGPDPAAHLAGIRAYVGAGFDEVYIGQVGGEHEGFFEFYADAVLPRLREG
jgi:hypothetical protein